MRWLSRLLISWLPIACFITYTASVTTSQQVVQYDTEPCCQFLLSCGASFNTNIPIENRVWKSDNASSYLLHTATSSSISAFSNQSSSPLIPLLSTARIFISPTKYSFPVSPGRYWVRLYFHPFGYQQFDPSTAVFSVTAASYTLLFDVNVTDAIATSTEALRLGYLFKEYSINVMGTSQLVLTFIPSSASPSHPAGYAFVNAIEVLSVPSNMFTDDTKSLGVNAPTPIGIPFMALETMHRLNVGGPALTPANDTPGLFRTWQPTNKTFLASPVGVENFSIDDLWIRYRSQSVMPIAPSIVYSTALQIINFSSTTYPLGLNLSFVLPVEPDFQYVVRLHFCELVYGAAGERVFNVYLQNRTALNKLDLGYRPGLNRAYYIDFSLPVRSGETSLWVQAGPPPNSTLLSFNHPILNGLEVWKLNNSQGSLDGRGVIPIETTSSPSPPHRWQQLGFIIGVSTAAAITVALASTVVAIILFKRHRGARTERNQTPPWVPLSQHDLILSNKASTTSSSSHEKSTVRGLKSVAAASNVGGGRQFVLADILDATHNFDESRVIGRGGFGKVYLGELNDGVKAAVKRGGPESQQGIEEFNAEINMLSKLRHRHLVSLIGYCDEQNELILVYEYMARGTLRGHLYGPHVTAPLPWKKRLEICVGAARGLHYLHTGAPQSIIHRDVKTTNILLDENFVAKVADFGLSKIVPGLDQTHVSTAVKGSFGYLDPEYFRRRQLTDKSDVYSFGVVLLEVLCAQPPIDRSRHDEPNLAEWALLCKSRGTLGAIVDPHVAGTLTQACLMKFADMAEQCLAEEGWSRPAMGDVLWSLELLHETASASASTTEEGVSLAVELSPVQAGTWEDRSATTFGSKVERSTGGPDDGGGEGEDEGEEEDMKAAFSQTGFPHGR